MGDITLKRLIKFLTVGASGAVISLSLLYLFTDIVGLHYMLSYLIAFVVAVANNYIWNSLWTFKDKKANFNELKKYVLVSLFTLGIREAILYLLTDTIGLWYIASGVLVIVTACLINFILSRKFVWNKPKHYQPA